jgi:hypothetical protein
MEIKRSIKMNGIVGFQFNNKREVCVLIVFQESQDEHT